MKIYGKRYLRREARKSGNFSPVGFIYAFWAIVILGFLLAVVIYLITSYPGIAFIAAIALIIGAILCFTRQTWSKRAKIISGCVCLLLTAIFITAGVLAIISSNKEQASLCRASNCTYSHEENSLYCWYHTCRKAGCVNYKEKSALYCYYHANEVIASDSGISLAGITLTNPSVTEEKYWYSFKINVNGIKNQGCYVILKIYNNDDKLIYTDYENVWPNERVGWSTACITVSYNVLRTYDHYEWTAQRSAPES